MTKRTKTPLEKLHAKAKREALEQTPRVFVCTVLDNHREPVRSDDGTEWSGEVVATTAAKARYSYWRDVSECWDTVKITDIRVRVADASRIPFKSPGWRERITTANRAIRIIGSHGRRFLSSNSDRLDPHENPHFAEFFTDLRGELWYRDRYKLRPVLVRHDDWPGFSDGGTLRSVIRELRDFIVDGTLPRFRVREYWGYDDASMCAVNKALSELFKEPKQ